MRNNYSSTLPSRRFYSKHKLCDGLIQVLKVELLETYHHLGLARNVVFHLVVRILRKSTGQGKWDFIRTHESTCIGVGGVGMYGRCVWDVVSDINNRGL